jgi:hypothetical protein
MKPLTLVLGALVAAAGIAVAAAGDLNNDGKADLAETVAAGDAAALDHHDDLLDGEDADADDDNDTLGDDAEDADGADDDGASDDEAVDDN